jgi:hypothetical protein
MAWQSRAAFATSAACCFTFDKTGLPEYVSSYPVGTLACDLPPSLMFNRADINAISPLVLGADCRMSFREAKFTHSK